MRQGLGSHLWVGLDVGTYSAKLYAVGAGGLGSGPARLAESPIPPRNGAPGEEPDVARAVGDCLTMAGVSPGSIRGLITGLAGPDVIVKQLQLPWMEDAEVGQALRFEARKHLPFDPQGMIIDYQIIGRYTSERRLDILLAAVSESRLERHLAPLRSLGLEPDIIDATPLALTNAMVTGLDLETESRVALDIGHESSMLSIYQRGEIYFSRRLPFGGRSITQAIAEANGIPLDEAEAWKLAGSGMRPTHLLDWHAPEMRPVLEAVRRDLVDELRRSFAFYQTQARLPDPLVIHMCGGTAQLPLLAERVGELIGAQVEVFEPPISPAVSTPRRGGPQFAQAYGLSLRIR